MKGNWNQDRYDEWVENTHIPQNIMDMVKFVCEKMGMCPPEEEVVDVRNVWGETIGVCKGFSISHCTSSYSDGPSPDYSKELQMWLGGLGFEIVGSHGDNGLDSETNWHDTYWTHDFGYSETTKYLDAFYDYDDDDDDVDDWDEVYDPEYGYL